MGDFLFRVRTHYKFTKQERNELIIAAIICAFILTFRKWGSTTFDAAQGITNLIVAFVALCVLLFIHISAQKLIAIKLGYEATYSYWLNGLFAGIIISFVTYGYLPVLLVGTVTIAHVERLRLGRFRYGLNYKDLAKISFAGPLASIAVILVLQPFFNLAGAGAGFHQLITDLIWMNVLLTVYALLPFKNTTGLNIIVSSRIAYVFCLAFAIIFSLLVLAANLFNVILALVLAVLTTIIFGTLVDKPDK
jgi:hypothetical protein